MGLQNEVNDISPDSLPILFLMFIAYTVSYIHNFLLALLHFLALSRFFTAPTLHADLVVAGSVAEQLNLNNKLSYSYNIYSRVDRGGGGGADCIVCLSPLRNGDCVRRLVCRHVFHKDCFDGWLNHLNFNCPLCRSPVVSGERLAIRGSA